MDFEKNKSTCDWSLLNSSISNPTHDELEKEIWYFFQHSDEEHPSAWLFCGTDEGPLYTLEIFDARRSWNGKKICNVEYIEYDNQDMNEEIEKKSLGTFSKKAVLELWKNFTSIHLRSR